MSKRSPYPYGLGTRKKGRSAKDWAGIALIVFVISLASGVGYWRYAAGEAHIALENTSFCPVSGPYAKTVLLIDLTDEISFIQEQKLKNYMHALADPENPDAIAQYTMLSVYLLSESDTDAIPVPIVEVCNPGSGVGLSEFTNNPKKANKKFIEKFVKPIDAAIGSIVHTTSADSSPIIESIRGISVSAFAQPPHEGYGHNLIIISDMLQNSSKTSHYREGQDIEADKFGGLTADLAMVGKIDIKVFARKEHASLQGKALVEYWRNYVRASGSSLSTIERWEE